MKRNRLTILTLMLCSLLSFGSIQVTDQRHGSDRHNNSRTERPGRGNGNNNIRPGGNHNNRPQAPGNNVRPGGNHNNRPQAPGNNNFRPGGNNHNRPQVPGNNNFRPGGNNHNRPQAPGNNNFRPGNNNRPPAIGHRPVPPPQHPAYRPTPNRPTYRPGPNRPAYIRPIVRPGRPPIRPWTRPVPPPRWRPTYTGNLLGNILGLTFGIAINSALDNLYYSGYNIDGYMNNQVYLTGVNQFNVFWPDATLYFGNGGLVRSQFFEPTLGYNTARFYNVYSTLCGLYGMPAINNTVGTNLSATWFGGGGDYITLQYTPMVSGNYNYFTILTVGR